jgi:dTMP kinase
MTKNSYGGLFIAFDGPNGVGKSTVIEHVESELVARNIAVFLTKEPTDTELGSFTRRIAETLDGESLTCLVAADRYHHLKQEVVPHLLEGEVVLSDRYVLSSLILQCMDGVNADFVLAVNEGAICPDIQVAISADRDIVRSRLAMRGQLTRFERGQRTGEELVFLQRGKNTLARLGIEVLDIENSGNLQGNVSCIVERILEAAKE